jgi:CHAD domain-containing protein
MEINHAGGNLSLRLPPQCGLEPLRSAFEVRDKSRESRRLAFYDTWEWNLWFQGLFLFLESNKIHLAGGKSGWPDTAHAVADAQRPFPRFAKEFADPQLRGKLAGITGLRALGKVAILRAVRRNCDLLNKLEKVVCRLELTEISTDKGEPLYRFIAFRPLRGYHAEAMKAREILEAHGATPMVDGPLAALFERESRTPQPHTLRPIFNIRRETPAREAVRKIVHRMLEIALSNEEGIIQDIDTEFLHDYRICIRKIRSVLSLVKGVYPQGQTESLKRTLATLGTATNRLRDLDVYLLARDEYIRLLPEPLRPGLETMFRDFAQERKGALKKVRAHLTSSSYRNQMEELDRFFTAPDALPVSPASEHPIGPLVARRIRKRYRMIRRLRRTLTVATPDTVVHRLRIDCKKLRYLLEFFSELFSADETAKIQKQLRRLQTRLGVFNDYSVQQAALLQYWNRKRQEGISGQVSDALSLSLGGLIAVLHYQQQIERERIHDALDAFSAKKVKGLFKRAFAVDPPLDPAPSTDHQA